MRIARIRQGYGETELRLAEADAVPSGLDWLPATTGTVYGTLLNFQDARDSLGDAVSRKPYQQAPRAPILYIKPANTLSAHGATITVPAQVEALEIGATLGIVIGQQATRVTAADAFDVIAGYTVVNDVSVPHADYYRPAIRARCRDGFCPIGPWFVTRDAVPDPAALSIAVRINGIERLRVGTGKLVRPVAQLIADVTEFMTLLPGDVLCIGVPFQSPRARSGDRVRIDIDGVGCLENQLLAATEDVQ